MTNSCRSIALNEQANAMSLDSNDEQANAMSLDSNDDQANAIKSLLNSNTVPDFRAFIGKRVFLHTEYRDVAHYTDVDGAERDDNFYVTVVDIVSRGHRYWSGRNGAKHRRTYVLLKPLRLKEDETEEKPVEPIEQVEDEEPDEEEETKIEGELEEAEAEKEIDLYDSIRPYPNTSNVYYESDHFVPIGNYNAICVSFRDPQGCNTYSMKSWMCEVAQEWDVPYIIARMFDCHFAALAAAPAVPVESVAVADNDDRKDSIVDAKQDATLADIPESTQSSVPEVVPESGQSAAPAVAPQVNQSSESSAARQAGAAFYGMYKEQFLTDITLCFNGQYTYRVHKLILADKMYYFEMRFKSKLTDHCLSEVATECANVSIPNLNFASEEQGNRFFENIIQLIYDYRSMSVSRSRKRHTTPPIISNYAL